jgi:hypothetical protein
MGQVQRGEWRWVIVVAALVVAASTLPYLAGFLAQTADWTFGGSIMDQVDYHTYLAKMWQGHQGSWRYEVPYTTESHEGAYLVTFYLVLGHLARLTGMSLPLIYQVARVAFGFIMLLAVYRFIALFASPLRTRRLAFLLATTASGLGWLTEIVAPTAAGGVSPMEFWLLDAYTYLAVLIFPHFSAAIVLLLAIYVLLLRQPEGPSLREAGLAILSSVALGVIHPFALLLADLVPALYWAAVWLRNRQVNWRGLAAVLAMGVAQLPILVYDLWVFRQPVFAGWSAQNITLSPPLPVYLWGYGLLILLGAAGVVAWARRDMPGLAFPVIWIVLVAILAHLPWNLQRRFLEGVQVPLGLLAGVGLAEALVTETRGRKVDRLRWLSVALLVSLMSMSNLYLTLGHTLAAAARSPALFWPASTTASVDWLGKNSQPEDVILADFKVGSLIPGRIGRRVVLGHWMETVNYKEKADLVSRFFDAATSPEERFGLLLHHGVGYVFYGPEERALGNFDPNSVDYLKPVFSNDPVSIYRVDLP